MARLGYLFTHDPYGPSATYDDTATQVYNFFSANITHWTLSALYLFNEDNTSTERGYFVLKQGTIEILFGVSAGTNVTITALAQTDFRAPNDNTGQGIMGCCVSLTGGYEARLIAGDDPSSDVTFWPDDTSLFKTFEHWDRQASEQRFFIIEDDTIPELFCYIGNDTDRFTGWLYSSQMYDFTRVPAHVDYTWQNDGVFAWDYQSIVNNIPTASRFHQVAWATELSNSVLTEKQPFSEQYVYLTDDFQPNIETIKYEARRLPAQIQVPLDGIDYGSIIGHYNAQILREMPYTNLTYGARLQGDNVGEYFTHVTEYLLTPWALALEAPFNNDPIALPSEVTTDFETATATTLQAYDSGGDALTYAVVANPANGVLSGTAPNLTYTPNGGFSGSDLFTFKANDGTADSNIQNFYIMVNGVATPLAFNPLRAYHMPWEADPTSAPADVQAQHQNAGISNGDPIVALTDWSTEQGHAVPNNDLQRALLDTAATGAPMALFDGSNDAYNGQLLTLGDNFQIFFVGAPSATLGLVYEIGPFVQTDPGNWMFAAPSGNFTPVSRISRTISGGGGVEETGFRGPWADGNIHLAQQFYEGTHASHSFLIDNVDTTTSASANADPSGSVTDNIYIGARTAGSTGAYNGYWGSLWVFENLTPSQITNVRDWLNAEYGGIF